MTKKVSHLSRGAALLLLFATILISLSSCTTNTPSGSETVETEPDVTVEAETKQYLDPTPSDPEPIPDDGIYIIYNVNSKSAGKISGKKRQKLDTGEEAEPVTAQASLGYRFVMWSDGLTTPERSGDSTAESVSLTAIFDYDILSLPILMLDTETGRDVTSKSEYIGASVSLAGAGKYDFTDTDVSVRGRGNNTWTYEKKSYRIKLSEKRNILGIASGKSKSWVLLANMCDQSLLRNDTALALDSVFRRVGWEPAATSVEVYLNGEYRGVYLLAEAITVDKNRVKLDDSSVQTDVDTGYLIKLSAYADTVDFVVAGKQYEIRSDLSTNASVAKKQRKEIGSYVEQCWNAVRTGNRTIIENLIDLESLIDAYLMEEYVKNLDMGWDSFYLYKDAGGKLCFGPLWDFDLSFGNGNETCERTDGIYCGILYNEGLSNPWFYRMNSYEWFRELCTARWNAVYPALRQIPERVRLTAENGYDSFCRNFEKWQIFGRCMNRETERITSLRTYREHYEYLAKWIGERGEWLNRYYNTADYRNGVFTNNRDIPEVRIGNDTANSLQQQYRALNGYINTASLRTADRSFPNEGVENLFDMRTALKYCTECSGEITISFSLDQARAITGYLLITANDTDWHAERNPDGWSIFGSNDKTNWKEIERISDGKNRLDAESYTAYGFEIDDPQTFRHYRIVFRNQEILQFADMILFG